jgi:molybdate transport system substrate-binding protein
VTTTAESPLVVYSTLSAKEALKDLVPAFERDRGQRLEVTYAGGSVLAKQLASGSAGDLFIGPEEFTRDLVNKGVLRAEDQQALALSSTALAISAGIATPETRTVDQVKQLLLRAKSFCYSPGASGIHFAGLLDRMGIGAAIASKAVRPGPGELVGTVVARGDAEVGVQQLSELLPVAGIRVLPLPPELRQSIRYVASVFADARRPRAAAAFVDYLRCADAARIWRNKGLEPL